MKAIFILLFSLLSAAAPLPQSQFLLDRQGYTINFDARTRNACWVYERLTQELLQKKQPIRGRFRFAQDYSIPAPFRANSEDFRCSGYDRGHLCPFADLPDHCGADSFLLSNISPQWPALNRGLWLRLENHVRDLAAKFEELHVFTIPLYLPETDKAGVRHVCYRVIGKHSIAVPTHFAKAIFAKGEEGVEIFAYLVPNQEMEQEKGLEDFRTSLQKLEDLSGILFPEMEEFVDRR